jgi:hypothetical protein
VTTTGWWILGYALGGAVVLVAAALLIAIVALGRQIVRQAGEITVALDEARAHTEPLFDLAMMNHAIESITRGLKEIRREEGPEDERSLVRRLADRLLPGASE